MDNTEVFNTLREAIESLRGQLTWTPEVVGELPAARRVCIAGMGGSALAARLIESFAPKVSVHSDYWSDSLKNVDVVIASSYSGNTEEVIDVAKTALFNNVDLVIVTHGGALLEFAQRNSLPYILLPEALQPRYAIGYSLRALEWASRVNLGIYAVKDVEERLIKRLASVCASAVPLIYTSTLHSSTGYVFKILLNETAKQPAFANVIPEMNHNEINAYGNVKGKHFGRHHVLMLLDQDDHPRNKVRMEALAKVLRKKGVQVEEVRLLGKNSVDRALYGWYLGMLVSLEAARKNEVDPLHIPVVEDFKRAIA